MINAKQTSLSATNNKQSVFARGCSLHDRLGQLFLLNRSQSYNLKPVLSEGFRYESRCQHLRSNVLIPHVFAQPNTSYKTARLRVVCLKTQKRTRRWQSLSDSHKNDWIFATSDHCYTQPSLNEPIKCSKMRTQAGDRMPEWIKRTTDTLAAIKVIITFINMNIVNSKVSWYE